MSLYGPVVRVAVRGVAVVAGAIGAGQGLSALVDVLYPAPAPSVLPRISGRTGKTVAAAALFGCAAVGIIRKLGARKLVLRPKTQESLVNGSVEAPSRTPDCQVHLAYENSSGQLDVIGSGLRMQVGDYDLLVTASHNLAYSQPLWLVKNGKQVCVGVVDTIPLAADASAVVVGSKPFVTLGVKVASLSPLSGDKQVVSITGLANKGTVGMLRVVKSDTQSIGSVEYCASTMGGYSGAPYVSGRSVFGMHAFGGARNGGYEILYLYAAAKVELGLLDEDSEDIYIQRLFAGEPDYTVQEKGGKVIVREHGTKHYHVLDREKFYAAENAWLYSDDEEYEQECASQPLTVALNSQAPGLLSRGGSCTPSVPQEPQCPSTSGQTSASKKRSKRRLKSPATKLQMQLEEQIASARRKLALLLNGDPSSSNQSGGIDV